MSTAVTADDVRERFIYDLDTGEFRRKAVRNNRHKIGEVAGHIKEADGYVRIIIDGKSYLAHRLAILYCTGDWPKHQVDHSNMNKADNRWVNLREATANQNGFNRPEYATNKSGHKGVSWYPKYGLWRVQAKVNGRVKHLGYFESVDEAADAYARFTTPIHKEFHHV